MVIKFSIKIFVLVFQYCPIRTLYLFYGYISFNLPFSDSYSKSFMNVRPHLFGIDYQNKVLISMKPTVLTTNYAWLDLDIVGPLCQ